MAKIVVLVIFIALVVLGLANVSVMAQGPATPGTPQPVPPTVVQPTQPPPPTAVPPTQAPPPTQPPLPTATQVPPTVQPTAVPPTAVPPSNTPLPTATSVPPTKVPPTVVPPTAVPATATNVPTVVPPTAVQPTATTQPATVPPTATQVATEANATVSATKVATQQPTQVAATFVPPTLQVLPTTQPTTQQQVLSVPAVVPITVAPGPEIKVEIGNVNHNDLITGESSLSHIGLEQIFQSNSTDQYGDSQIRPYNPTDKTHTYWAKITIDGKVVLDVSGIVLPPKSNIFVHATWRYLNINTSQPAEIRFGNEEFSDVIYRFVDDKRVTNSEKMQAHTRYDRRICADRKMQTGTDPYYRQYQMLNGSWVEIPGANGYLPQGFVWSPWHAVITPHPNEQILVKTEWSYNGLAKTVDMFYIPPCVNQPTVTQIPPTATFVPTTVSQIVTETTTAVPPTATFTRTPKPSKTPKSTLTPRVSSTPNVTAVMVVPSATPAAMATETATNTANNVPTNTPGVPSQTLSATSPATIAVVASATVQQNATAAWTNTPTVTPSKTYTPSATASPTLTNTPVFTATSVTPTTVGTQYVPTASYTPTASVTPSLTYTPSPTVTNTPTNTATVMPSVTATVIATSKAITTLAPSNTPGPVSTVALFSASPTPEQRIPLSYNGTPSAPKTATPIPQRKPIKPRPPVWRSSFGPAEDDQNSQDSSVTNVQNMDIDPYNLAGGMLSVPRLKVNVPMRSYLPRGGVINQATWYAAVYKNGIGVHQVAAPSLRLIKVGDIVYVGIKTYVVTKAQVMTKSRAAMYVATNGRLTIITCTPNWVSNIVIELTPYKR